MTKFFKKSKKILFWGPFWALFAQIWAKMNFPGKKGCHFLNIPIIYHRAKNSKKQKYHSREKCQIDDWTDRRTDNDDFIGPSVRRGSKNQYTVEIVFNKV